MVNRFLLQKSHKKTLDLQGFFVNTLVLINDLQCTL